jgi:hypothetical protein
MSAATPAILRSIAIAIAVAALIDPVFTVERAQTPRLVLVDLTQNDASPIADRLRTLDPDLQVRTAIAGRIPCAPGERCVIAADGSEHAQAPTDVGSPISLVTLAPVDGANVSIQSATTVATQHGSAAGVVRVAIKGQGVAGRRTTLRALDAGAVVGSASLEWKTDTTQVVDVPWWPIAASARALRIEAESEGGETSAFDNAIDLAVTVGNRALPVLVLDARPSWSSTFVRRALEDDPRFVVDHRARVAPALTTGTATARLDAAALDVVPLVIAGAPDALTTADVDLLDRFVRVRGGTLIVLPERAPAGAAARLFPGEWSEQLLAEPEQVGPLRAAELLRPRQPRFGSVALTPVTVAAPAGNGRIIVSGAMDAWRHRDADAASFDRFWTSLSAEGAAAGEGLVINFDDGLAPRGSRIGFTVRYRALSMPPELEASAVATCDSATMLRLWPAGAAGVFRGELPVGSTSSCSLEVAVNGRIAGAAVAVAERPARGVEETIRKLSNMARASGGVVITDEDNIAERLRASLLPSGQMAQTQVYPMRAAWWMFPFAGCLSAEWWLRRRRGLR